MIKKNIVLSLIFLIFITGCASKLLVYSSVDNPKTIRGIRVYPTVSYVLTKEIETVKCLVRTEESIIQLPAGDAYDINFYSAPFAKSEFTVILNENGSLKQVTLNSTPQAGETIKALTELIGTAAAILTPKKEKEEKDCGAVTKETIKSVRRLEIK